MSKKYLLIIIIAIITAILVVGILYYFVKNTDVKNEKGTGGAKDETANSIKLEKPPFIKD